MTRKHISIKNIIGRKNAGSDFVKDNAGLSLVELIVAVAILAVVFTPIVNSFLTTSRTNARAQSIQNATSLAETVMEDVKAKSIEQLKAEAAADDNMTFTEVYASATPEEGERPIKYTVTYKDKTATNGKKYDVNVVVDSQPYSYEKGVVKADGTLPDPDDVSNANLVEVPVFKEIDSSKNAVISWEINRYDGVAIETLLDQTAAFNKNYPTGTDMNTIWYYNAIFPILGSFMKQIDIDVTRDGSKADVSCVVTYKKDPNKTLASWVRDIPYDPVSYTVYSSQFDLDKDPDIYIFYNLMVEDEEVIKRSVNSIQLATDSEKLNINIDSPSAGTYNSNVYFIVQKKAGKENDYSISDSAGGAGIVMDYLRWGGDDPAYAHTVIDNVTTGSDGLVINGHRFVTNLNYSYTDGTETIDLTGELYDKEVNDNIYEVTVSVLDGSDTQATLSSTLITR